MAYRKVREYEIGKELKRTPGVRSLTVVHISDTHTRHHEYKDVIPNGDILIHSGDFANRIESEEQFQANVSDFGAFLAAQPHTHKIFVAGNHDTLFDKHSRAEIEALMPGIIYLQDSSVTLGGLKFYGSPWSNCYTAFTATEAQMAERFAAIPSDTDMLITHIPPRLLLDLAWRSGVAYNGRACGECGQRHSDDMEHWGSLSLQQRVQHVMPKCHFFGHVHDDAGIREHAGVVYCNAALDIYPSPRRIRLHYVPREFRWRLERSGAHTYYVVNVATNCVLDIDCASTEEGAQVIAWPKLGDAKTNQQWSIVSRGDGSAMNVAEGEGVESFQLITALNGFAVTALKGASTLGEERTAAVMHQPSDSHHQQMRLDREGRVLCGSHILAVTSAFCSGFEVCFL
eukprot:TRINITY_DN3057_c0_g1_i3.p1 TRINITY_DN3057_c0_g1~~TRINITY_DN3057_c0_g1_i3.p1  ORF type:complete len:400 (+),score=93.24 TRINITY_DN3057_c0_g1_i3:40-1239(+)